MFRVLCLAATLIAAPAGAEGFKRKGDRLAIPAAGIAVPATLAGMKVTANREFALKGQGLDNNVQWESADGLVFVSAYVYRPPLADASLAAYATDRAVRLRFGPTVTIAEQGAAGLAGRPGTVIRTIYTGGQVEVGKPLVTAAAFASVGAWTLKLRASGPADRRAEVIGALDALIAAIIIDRPGDLRETRPLAFDAPCPAAGTSTAKVLPETLGSDAMIGMLLSGIATSKGMKPMPPVKTADRPFPAEGTQRACVRGAIRLGPVAADLIQPSGTDRPDIQLAAMSDSGNTLVVAKGSIDNNYAIKLYTIGQIETLGHLDGQPTPAQLQGWIDRKDKDALKMSSRSIYDATGKERLQLPGGATMSAEAKR